MAEKTVVDTSILISLFNERKFETAFLELNQRSQIYLSVVSANELIRGCHDKVSMKIIEDFLECVDEQILTPSREQWIECATLTEKILKGKRRTRQEVLLLQNDILIALGAREAKARLATADKKDFTLLQGFVNVSIDFW